FPELLYEGSYGGNNWYFNTPIAEQTNVWFGHFHPICREMGAVFCEFFLNRIL
ncbi:hypothetical protein K435DRAFT_589244, partial [Dendrothele bispora CBS 962.96]